MLPDGEEKTQSGRATDVTLGKPSVVNVKEVTGAFSLLRRIGKDLEANFPTKAEPKASTTIEPGASALNNTESTSLPKNSNG
jgi:hypothetical protein